MKDCNGVRQFEPWLCQKIGPVQAMPLCSASTIHSGQEFQLSLISCLGSSGQASVQDDEGLLRPRANGGLAIRTLRMKCVRR
jgi:hypothetical protein